MTMSLHLVTNWFNLTQFSCWNTDGKTCLKKPWQNLYIWDSIFHICNSIVVSFCTFQPRPLVDDSFPCIILCVTSYYNSVSDVSNARSRYMWGFLLLRTALMVFQSVVLVAHKAQLGSSPVFIANGGRILVRSWISREASNFPTPFWMKVIFLVTFILIDTNAKHSSFTTNFYYLSVGT